MVGENPLSDLIHGVQHLVKRNQLPDTGQRQLRGDQRKMTDALFHAGAIGYLAMRNATVAGAVGGCQAEVGVGDAAHPPSAVSRSS